MRRRPPFGTRDPLAQRLFRDKKRTRDLRRGEAADQGPPLRRLHQPCPGIVRCAFLGSNFEGSHERIQSQLLGNADIVGDASNRGDRRVDSIFHTASIVLATSLMQPRLRRSGARSLRPLFERPRGSRTSRESGELRPPRGWTSEHAWPIRWPLPASGPG